MTFSGSPSFGSPRSAETATSERADDSNWHPAFLEHRALKANTARDAMNMHYNVRNTFIDYADDGGGNSDESPMHLREIQSCPGTALLSNHLPRGLASTFSEGLDRLVALGSLNAQSPRSCSSSSPTKPPSTASACPPHEPLGSDLSKPWTADLIAELVKNSAALVEALSPQSGHLKAAMTEAAHADPVAAAVASAVAAASTVASSAEGTDAERQNGSSTSQSDPEKLFAQLLANNAPVATVLQAFEAFKTAGGSSAPLAGSFDAEAAAKSFAPIQPECSQQRTFRQRSGPGDADTWWRPLEDVVEARFVRLQAFITENSLDDRCVNLLRSLSPEEVEKALTEFHADAATRNRSGRFETWVNSWRLRASDASSFMTLTWAMPTLPTEKDRCDFVAQWGLDAWSKMALEGHALEVQREVMNTFSPPLDTRSVNGKFTSFLNCTSRKMSTTLAADAAAKGRQTAYAQTEGLAMKPAVWLYPSHSQNRIADISRFAHHWNLDTSCEVALLQCPDSVSQIIMAGFCPSAGTVDKNKKFMSYLGGVQSHLGAKWRTGPKG